MFEKEAKDYVYDRALKDFYPDKDKINWVDYIDLLITFQDAAKFGYNKANEWHYVKDGDLPKKSSKTKLYAVWYGDDDYSVVQFVRGRFWSFICGWIGIDEVIAWCELPEPPKERE